MNTKDALAKAHELLGKKAMVERRKCRRSFHRKDGRVLCTGVGAHRQPCPGGLMTCKVGTFELEVFFSVKGAGSTWEEAFARVEWRVHVDICRKRWVRQLCRKCSILDQNVKRYVG